MIDDTITLDDPKFIRYGVSCYYCFGNCSMCNIRFMCWSGEISLPEDKYPVYANVAVPGGDEIIELVAFGNVEGRIILQGVVSDRYHRVPYEGNQLGSRVFRESDLLYVNKYRQVCCKRRPRSVHHVKNWG